MKNIFLTLALLLTVSFVFATKDHAFKEINIPKVCTLTSSGTVYTSSGNFEATISVTGTCDASLSRKLIDAIAELRAKFK